VEKIQFYIAFYLAKIVFFIIKVLKIGSGFTWPGHIALKVYPDILSDSRLSFKSGTILISGTNGKTTTAKLVTHVLEESGLKVINNRTGANLMNGIVSEILLNLDPLGRNKNDIGVFEIDENNLPIVLDHISPNVLVLLNLSRDQLDRYGEIDIIFDKWVAAIEDLDGVTELVLDSTQEYFKKLPDHFAGDITWFGTEGDYIKHTKLVGNFNVKNVNAAVYTAQLIGVQEKKILAGLKTFDFAYGRGEKIQLTKEHSIVVYLAKNPASFNNNLIAIIDKEVSGDSLLIILNDQIPDGRDVSWIYDINPLLLKKACSNKEVFVAGDRCWDMAARLNYASVNVSEDNIFENITDALSAFSGSESRNLIALPNYSAMLDLRKILLGRRIL